MFISNNSYDRRGYLQREIKIALDKMNEMLNDDIFIVPVLLDDGVPVPDELKLIQYISASRMDCKAQIVNAINHQLNVLGIQRREVQSSSGISWDKYTLSESKEGIPGYEVKIDLLNFHSSKYSKLSELSEHIKGSLLTHLFENRMNNLEPVPEFFNYGQELYQRTNLLEATVAEPIIVGRVISIKYSVMRFGAGGAHPNSWYETFNFVLDPPALISPLSRIFKDRDVALSFLQSQLRPELYNLSSSRNGSGSLPQFNQEWIDIGTSTWETLEGFRFTADGIEISFGDYKIWSYANGTHTSVITYQVLLPIMKPHYVSMLQLDHLRR